MARMQRRFGVYCANIPTNTSVENKEPKRRNLPRRCAIVSEHNLLQDSNGMDEQSKKTVTPTVNARPVLSRLGRSEIISSDLEMHTISQENIQLAIRPPLHDESTTTRTASFENDENKSSRNTDKLKKEYVTPSPPDIIMDCLGRRHGGNIGIKGYVEALYADRYEEAGTRLERALIVCTVLDSIKIRGGKFLKESTSKQGLYYEVDEWYSMKKIEEALNQSNRMVKRVSCP